MDQLRRRVAQALLLLGGTLPLYAQTPGAVISVTPPVVAFGIVTVGSSADREVTISSVGTATLTVSSVIVGSAVFTIVDPPTMPFTLAPGDDQLLTVRCTPVNGSTTNTQLIAFSDAESGASTAQLQCTGGITDIDVSPGALVFAGQRVGTTSAAQTVTISNAGTTTLVVSYTKAGAAANDYQVSGMPPPYIIGPGASRSVDVTFTPSAQGSRTATLDVSSNDPDEPTVSVSLSGTGLLPDLTLLVPSVAFGDVSLGEVSAPAPITIRNDGDADLVVDGVSVVGPDAAEFEVVSGSVPPPALTVAPSANATWEVRCAPTTVGVKAATFRIESDDPDEDPTDVPLSCTAFTGLRFHTLAPCRAIDTRSSVGPSGGPALVAQQSRTFTISGLCGIPPTAQAVSVNIAVTGSTAAGHLRLYPAGASVPTISVINYGAGQTRSNNAIGSLTGSGEFSLFCGQATGTVHAIVDVNGYFQ